MAPTAPSWPRRGDIFWFDFNPARGSEQAGRRPAAVISRNEFNKGSGCVVLAAITSSERQLARRRTAPSCVHLPQGRPTDKESLILASQLTTASHDRLLDYVGCLDGAQMLELDRALRFCFAL